MDKTLTMASAGRALWIAALVLAAAAPAHADEAGDRIKALEERLAASVQMIERLAARVSELERAAQSAASGAPAGAPGVTNGAGDPARAITDLQASVKQISEGLSRTNGESGLPLHGFADVGAGWSTARDPARLRGFNAGSLDVYLTPQLGDRVKSLVEVVFEHLPSGENEVETERLQIGYTVSDALTLWMGRFHTPIGLWNTSFHHGAYLQTTIFRPRFIDFEDKGGIIPTHTVGLWASGKTRLGAGKLNYDAYFGNGPSIRDRVLAINAFTDDDSSKTLGLNLGYQPGGIAGDLTVGVHARGSTVSTYANSGGLLSRTRFRLSGAYLRYAANDWEALGEYYRVADSDAAGGAKRISHLWFAQLGRDYGSLTPYVRYERAALDLADSYFLSQQAGRPYQRWVGGLRYELDTRSSLKAELSTTREADVLQIDASGSRVPFAAARYRRAALEYSIAF